MATVTGFNFNYMLITLFGGNGTDIDLNVQILTPQVASISAAVGFIPGPLIDDVGWSIADFRPAPGVVPTLASTTYTDSVLMYAGNSNVTGGRESVCFNLDNFRTLSTATNIRLRVQARFFEPSLRSVTPIFVRLILVRGGTLTVNPATNSFDLNADVLATSVLLSDTPRTIHDVSTFLEPFSFIDINLTTNTTTLTDIPRPTNTPTNTATPTLTPTNTSTPTVTPTQTPTETVTPTVTPTNTSTPTSTVTSTPTLTQTPTRTPTLTPTSTCTPTLTQTSTCTPTTTLTTTPTTTTTPTVTPTNTETPTVTPSSTTTPTITPTNTETPTVTPTNTATPTVTPTNTETPTVTPTPTKTPTLTPTLTQTNTPTSTPRKKDDEIITTATVATLNTDCVVIGSAPIRLTFLPSIFSSINLDEVYKVDYNFGDGTTKTITYDLLTNNIKLIPASEAVIHTYTGVKTYKGGVTAHRIGSAPFIRNFCFIVEGVSFFDFDLIGSVMRGSENEMLYVFEGSHTDIRSIVAPVAVNWKKTNNLTEPVKLYVPPTPTSTSTPTTTPTPTLSLSFTPTQTPTNTLTSSVTPTPTLTPTLTLTATTTPTPTSTSTVGKLITADTPVTSQGEGTRMYRLFVEPEGTLTISYDTYNIPDKYTILTPDRVEIANSGWVGSSYYNKALNSLGLPNVSGPPQGVITVDIPDVPYILIVLESISHKSSSKFTASVISPYLATEDGDFILTEDDNLIIAC